MCHWLANQTYYKSNTVQTVLLKADTLGSILIQKIRRKIKKSLGFVELSCQQLTELKKNTQHESYLEAALSCSVI